MTYKTAFRIIEPPASLRQYVSAFWISDTTEPHILHIMPTNRPVLMTCDTPNGFGIVLVGPLRVAQHVPLQQGNRKVGAWLTPGTRCLFQPRSMEALCDGVVLAADMQPAQLFTQFNAAIQSLHDGSAMVDTLQALLEQLIKQNLLVHDKVVDTVIARMEQDTHQSVLTDLTRNLPISYRQLVRRFKTYSGLTPKAFLSTVRLGAAVSSASMPELVTLADIAAAHGYADHAHFTRELSMRAGVTPSALAGKQVVI